MQELLIIYGVLGFIAIGAQYLLYQREVKDWTHWLNLAIGLVLAFIAFTSFPSNETILKLIAVGFGLVGVSSLYFKSVNEQPMLPKILLTVSIVGNFVLLFM